MVYRPRMDVDYFVVLLQSNVRIFIARRARVAARQLRQHLLIRVEALPQLEIQQESKLRWDRYVAHCKLHGAPPVSILRDQLSSGGIMLSHYRLTTAGLSCMTSMITELLTTSKLTYLSLTDMDIDSSGIEILASGLCGNVTCPVRNLSKSILTLLLPQNL